MGPEPPLLWRGPEKGALTGIEGRESVLSCGRTGPAGTQQEMVPEVSVAVGHPGQRVYCPLEGCSKYKATVPKARDLAELKARELVPDILLIWVGEEERLYKVYQALFCLKSYLVFRTAGCRADH